MAFFRSNGSRVPAAVEKMGAEVRAGRMDRREFLAMASALGASTAAAYGMAGLAVPTPALAQEGQKGGTLRVAMAVKGQKDPRTYDWVELGNIARTWLEPLVSYTREFTFESILLDSWEEELRGPPDLPDGFAESLARPGLTARVRKPFQPNRSA